MYDTSAMSSGMHTGYDYMLRAIGAFTLTLHDSQPFPRAHTTGEHLLETDAEQPRSASATSSLDPYYFSVQTPAVSPIPAVPTVHNTLKTPEMRSHVEPVTPGKDPASIDRRGLVGVGELATPRWVRAPRKEEIEIDDQVDEIQEEELDDGFVEVAALDMEMDLPDSPWTIEAVDGEADEKDEVGVLRRSAAARSDRLFSLAAGCEARLASTTIATLGGRRKRRRGDPLSSSSAPA